MDNPREAPPDVTIAEARVERDKLLVRLSDGSVRAVALASITALATATPEQVSRLEHGPGSVSWPALGLQLDLESLWRLPITSVPAGPEHQ